MTVKELKEKLNHTDDDAEVVVLTEDSTPVLDKTPYSVTTSTSFYDEDSGDNIFVLYF